MAEMDMAWSVEQPAAELDRARFPNLTGVESPFLDFWTRHIIDPDDPHRLRWTEREEHAVESAGERTEVIESVVDLRGRSVLDVGCQNGAWLVSLGLAGAHPTGIDRDALPLEAAQIRARCYGVQVRTRQASACEMPFATGEFDVVASSCVLEHVPDKVAMLHECVRVLKPGGFLVLSAPLRFSPKHLMADPHYQHRGVSVLPGSVARWWVTTFRGEADYDVETLPTKHWVERQLTQRGMRLVPVDPRFTGRPVPGPAAVRSIVDELRQVFLVIARKPFAA